MKTITRREFVDLISQNKGCEAIAIDISSTPRMRKTNNPYLDAVKHVTLSGLIGFDYENSVNNQLTKEGKDATFESQGRTWGVYFNPYFIVHKDNFYLNLKVQGATEPVFTLNNKEIDAEKLKPFLYEDRTPNTQTEAGIEKEVIVRTIKVDSVVKLRYKGEEYLIKE